MGFFNACFKEHQEKSRTIDAGSFKGGLADTGVQTTRLHTAVHLLQAGLRKLISNDIYQKGSNITSERLRFDFTHDKAVTKEELKKVEEILNNAIMKGMDVVTKEMPPIIINERTFHSMNKKSIKSIIRIV